MSIIEMKNIKKSYGDKEVLKGVELKIPENEICLIMGPSGAGKSTLLNIFAFIEKADSGEYLWKGENVNNISQGDKRKIRRDNMSFIFQDFNVFEELTVKENIEVFLRHATSIESKDWNDIILRNVEEFGISDRLNTRAKLLSGGERQRLAILRSFIKKTQIVFADEPSANIDDENKKLILGYFKTFKQEGRTVVIVSHDSSYIDFVDRVYKFEDGKIQI